MIGEIASSVGFCVRSDEVVLPPVVVWRIGWGAAIILREWEKVSCQSSLYLLAELTRSMLEGMIGVNALPVLAGVMALVIVNVSISLRIKFNYMKILRNNFFTHSLTLIHCHSLSHNNVYIYIYIHIYAVHGVELCEGGWQILVVRIELLETVGKVAGHPCGIFF